ncbi:DUF5329 domain-containing protein [Lysobacter firmicutimachus]|uniref:DUF5329 domain-containing protein n=1 Tax=Lysobacter firmicutimachus TaxID=1792846 RepID=A0AAU8MQD4_9GAMM
MDSLNPMQPLKLRRRAAAPRSLRRAGWLLAGLLACFGAQAAPSAQAEREIEQLIQALGRSGCQFERNGSWHDAAQAQAHLRKKLAYLRKRDLADTAEAFIDRAASRSSLSGQPYRVRCGQAAPVSSASWLRGKLVQLRSAGVSTPPSR